MAAQRLPFAVIILAAGQGKRMNSPLPKVLHPLGGRPLIDWVIESARTAGAARIVTIVGHGKEQVIEALPGSVEYAVQDKQMGTGHAARCAESVLKDWPHAIVVLSGDVPLLRSATIRELAWTQADQNAAAVVLTAKVEGEHAYGRILRDARGQVTGIVEHKDATPEQKKISEINTGTYCFGPGKLFPALAQLKNENAQGEYYLTDTLGHFVQQGGAVSAVLAPVTADVMGVNTPEDLAAAGKSMQERRESSANLGAGGSPEIFARSEMTRNLRIFTGNANPKLAEDICAYLNLSLGKAEVSHFPDGESKVRISEDIRGRDVFIVQSTCPPVNDHLMELLVLIDAARRASANRITAVIPYYGYARQDRKHEGRVPITAKLVANLLTTAGADRVMSVELHAEQIQGFFDVPVDHLSSMPVQINHIRSLGLQNLTVLSPDLGRTKLTEKFARRLRAGLAVIEKRRMGDNEVVKGHVVGDIRGRDVLIVDDMITTAGSISQAVHTALEYGAKGIYVAVTHPVFSGRAYERLNGLPVKELAVCNTIEVKKKPENITLTTLNVAQLIGEAIRRIHYNESVSILFE
jgi:ribose-phosphate pyrophosphokinase